MAKVFGIHTFELRPGVTEADFERYMIEAGHKIPDLPGEKSYFVKGDRGEHAGAYLLIVVIDSVADRDRLYPSPTELSAEALQRFETYKAIYEQGESLATHAFTDYVVLGE
jgi:hypothetical protein